MARDSQLMTNDLSTLPRGLARLLGCYDLDTFYNEDLGERMLHLTGPNDRWAGFFSWRDLSTLLNEGFATTPRLRLLRNGAEVDSTLFMHENGRGLDAIKCQALMARGATLIVQGVEIATPALEALTRELTNDLNGHVRMDVVATTSSVPGLRMHWDNAECFNLQLDGEKIWQVVRPERSYPLTATKTFPRRMDTIRSKAPDVPPTWTGAVAPGDLIYLPRGWWHAVSPHVSPSLHLSIAVDLPTMTDFMQWVAAEATRHEELRRILPAWKRSSERREQISDRLTALAALLIPESVEAYLAQLGAEGTPQRLFALPDAAVPGAPRLSTRTKVRLRSISPLHLTAADGVVSFEWQGRTVRFDDRLRPALEKLASLESHAIADLGDDSIRVLVRALVLSLHGAGLLFVVND